VSTQTKKPKASFGVTKINVPGVLARATLMQTAILAALAIFTSLPITMPAFLLLIQAAAAAQAATASKAKGLAAIRDTKVDKLWTAMQSLKTYVQGLSDATDAVSAVALIQEAGLLVARTPKSTKLLLAATFMPATGVVHLAVNATLLLEKPTAKKTIFTWSWSTDGGKTWSAGVTTAYANADIPGLPPATYQFRVFVTVGTVPQEPCQPVGLTIH
jgi:hypothetical protein